MGRSSQLAEARPKEVTLRTVSHLEGHAVSRPRVPGRRISSLNTSAPLIAYRGPHATGKRPRGRGTPESRTPYARRSRSPKGLRRWPSR
jgi:hypothetical protein